MSDEEWGILKEDDIAMTLPANKRTKIDGSLLGWRNLCRERQREQQVDAVLFRR
jgi:hypothetical protein